MQKQIFDQIFKGVKTLEEIKAEITNDEKLDDKTRQLKIDKAKLNTQFIISKEIFDKYNKLYTSLIDKDENIEFE